MNLLLSVYQSPYLSSVPTVAATLEPPLPLTHSSVITADRWESCTKTVSDRAAGSPALEQIHRLVQTVLHLHYKYEVKAI